jgi:hypothetical protein
MTARVPAPSTLGSSELGTATDMPLAAGRAKGLTSFLQLVHYDLSRGCKEIDLLRSV